MEDEFAAVRIGEEVLAEPWRQKEGTQTGYEKDGQKDVSMNDDALEHPMVGSPEALEYLKRRGIGSEEAMPVVFRLPTLAKALGVPYFPITANLLTMGPLGVVMPFPAKFKLRVLDPVHFDVPPEQERYSKSRIMDAAEDIRVNLQDTLYEMLRERRSVWY